MQLILVEFLQCYFSNNFNSISRFSCQNLFSLYFLDIYILISFKEKMCMDDNFFHKYTTVKIVFMFRGRGRPCVSKLTTSLSVPKLVKRTLYRTPRGARVTVFERAVTERNGHGQGTKTIFSLYIKIYRLLICYLNKNKILRMIYQNQNKYFFY